MSTILKALRRVEGDRSAQSARPLREEVASGGREARARGRRGWLLLTLVGVGSGVLAGTLAFLSVRSEPEAPRVAQAPVVAARPAPPPSAPAPAQPAGLREPAAPALRERPLETRELPPAALVSRVERVERPPAGPRIAEEEPEPLEPAPVVAALPPSRMPGRHRPQTPSALPIDEPAASSAPIGGRAAPPAPAAREPVEEPRLAGEVHPLRTPEPAPARRTSEDAGAAGGNPERHELREPVVRAPVPPLTVKETVWHPDAARRFALVDPGDGSPPVQVHEGDAVGTLVVQEIKPSGVRFDHDGIEVDKAVGN